MEIGELEQREKGEAVKKESMKVELHVGERDGEYFD